MFSRGYVIRLVAPSGVALLTAGVLLFGTYSLASAEDAASPRPAEQPSREEGLVPTPQSLPSAEKPLGYANIGKKWGNTSENPNAGFFKKDIARDIWGESVEMGAQEEFHYFPSTNRPNLPAALTPTPAAAPNVAAAATPRAHPPPKNAQEIQQEFGDPSEDEPVLGDENAPRPVKGMMRALQLGDRELAFGYARKYVRYIKSVQARTTEIMSLTGVAMKREGTMDERSAKTWPILSEDQKILEAELAKNNELTREHARVASLDPATRQLLEAAAEAEGVEKEALADGKKAEASVLDTGITDKQAQDQALRSRVKAELAGKLPIDSKGKVDIYFFFRVNDVRSKQMARELEKLYREVIEDGRVHVAGLTIEPTAQFSLDGFQRETGVSFPLKNGASLAKALGLRTVPTTSFVAVGNGKSWFEEGVRPFERMDEIRKIMQGGR